MTVRELLKKLQALDPNAVVARYTNKGAVEIEDIDVGIVEVAGLDSDQCTVYRPVTGVVLT